MSNNSEQTKWNTKARQYRELKQSYEKYLKKLETLKTNISSTPDDLVKAQKNFMNGGYVDSGETLDRGKLLEIKGNIENVLENLNNVISNTKYKIKELEKQISYCKKMANQAVIDASKNY